MLYTEGGLRRYVFEITDTRFGKVWTPVIEAGPQCEFDENTWGDVTCRCPDPIIELDDEDFGLIVGDTLKVVKDRKLTSASSCVDLEAESAAYEHLYYFR